MGPIVKHNSLESEGNLHFKMTGLELTVERSYQTHSHNVHCKITHRGQPKLAAHTLPAARSWWKGGHRASPAQRDGRTNGQAGRVSTALTAQPRPAHTHGWTQADTHRGVTLSAGCPRGEGEEGASSSAKQARQPWGPGRLDKWPAGTQPAGGGLRIQTQTVQLQGMWS